MTHLSNVSDNFSQPGLADLFAQYLRRQTTAQAAGLAPDELGSEVVPFEAAPIQPVDAGTAWKDALTALTVDRPGIDRTACAVPPDWPSLVAGQEPALGLPLCICNFPQAVRSLHSLLESAAWSGFPPTAARPISAPALLAWAGKFTRKPQFPEALIALGALRLAKQFALAEELLALRAEQIPIDWRGAWDNERAGLAWHQGRTEEAVRLWQSQAETVPVLFNRGMAALFTGQPEDAQSSLSEAVRGLPEENSWHHLGKLYLALAEMRG